MLKLKLWSRLRLLDKEKITNWNLPVWGLVKKKKFGSFIKIMKDMGTSLAKVVEKLLDVDLSPSYW